MTRIQHTSCCGVSELSGITDYADPKVILEVAANNRFRDGDANGAYYIFTDTGRGTYGNRLRKYIEDNKLGTVSQTKGKRNPNTGNSVILYTWMLNVRGFKAWYRKNYPSEAEYIV